MVTPLVANFVENIGSFSQLKIIGLDQDFFEGLSIYEAPHKQ